MTPRALLAVGAALLLFSLLLVAAASALEGPKNPECEGRPLSPDCRDAGRFAGLALQWLALPLAIVGGIVVAVGLTRLSPDDGPKRPS